MVVRRMDIPETECAFTLDTDAIIEYNNSSKSDRREPEMTTKERTYDRVAKVHYSAYFEPELARRADSLMAADGFTSRSAWLKAVIEWYILNRPNIGT